MGYTNHELSFRVAQVMDSRELVVPTLAKLIHNQLGLEKDSARTYINNVVRHSLVYGKATKSVESNPLNLERLSQLLYSIDFPENDEHLEAFRDKHPDFRYHPLKGIPYKKLGSYPRENGEYSTNHKAFLRLLKIYNDELPISKTPLSPRGYDIEEIIKEENGLVVALIEEDDVKIDPNEAIGEFQGSLEQWAQRVGAINPGFNVSYEDKKVTITIPHKIRSWAFLESYRTGFLERKSTGQAKKKG